MEKLYNTYSFGEELTFFELDGKVIRGVEYLLLLQKQEPNLIVVAIKNKDKIEIVKNKVLANELLKGFTKDKERFAKLLEPFVKKDNKDTK